MQMVATARNRAQAVTPQQPLGGEEALKGVVHREAAATMCSVIIVTRTCIKQLLPTIKEKIELCGNRVVQLFDVTVTACA